MQLFHEMKQKFATVPDHIVANYVAENCHNRVACIDRLEQEAENHPGSGQAYPQSLRGNTSKRPPIVQRRTPAPPVVAAVAATKQPIQSEVTLKHSDTKASDMPIHKNLNATKLPERPTTLSLESVPTSFPQLFHKPTRAAPPPPSPASASTAPSQQSNNATPAFADAAEHLNLSLNVTVSPVSARPPQRPPRHTTTMSVHPELSFSRAEPQSSSPRSFNNVNFTLRQPSDTPQSPIDIKAGSSLTYSSNSYNAQIGYQSRLEITVNGAGGAVSASRTRPRSCYNIPVISDESSSCGETNSVGAGELNSGLSCLRVGVSMPNVAAIATHVTSPDEGKYIIHIVNRLQK